jgi:hypothetical protein
MVICVEAMSSSQTPTTGVPGRAFGEFMLESSMDFGNKIFPVGSSFVFGSWICVIDNDGRLQS